MKRCPECRRDYYDETLLYCLDDGAALLEGPGEPVTAILHETARPGEAKTQTQVHVTDGGPRKQVSRTWKFAVIGIVIALVVVGFFGYRVWFGGGGEQQIDSVAVMPFVNQGGDPNAEYLSDGLTESIINNLSQLPSLHVTPRTSVFRYKGKDIDPIRAATELGVGAVVTGRILQRGDDLVVSAELLDVSSKRQIWGEQYNRKLSDALTVQQAISREISERLRTKLTGEEQSKLTKRDTADPEAYAAYIKGRYYWNKRTAENIRRALDEFQNAADQDPNYALAYAGLADCYVVMGDYAGTATADTLPKAKTYAERALELDGSLAEARASLAFAYHQMWRWDEAQKEFERATTAGANYPTAHHWYYLHLRDMGRIDEAVAQIERAQELDPVSPIIGTNVGLAYLSAGQIDRAAQQFHKVLEMDPRFPRARVGLGLVSLEQGRFADAVAELEKAVELTPAGDRQVLRDLAHAYGRAGDHPKALSLLERIRKNYENKQALGQDVAAIYVGLGDYDQAFAWLEKDFQARDARLARTKYSTVFAPILKDSRFADLTFRMGLPTKP